MPEFDFYYNERIYVDCPEEFPIGFGGTEDEFKQFTEKLELSSYPCYTTKFKNGQKVKHDVDYIVKDGGFSSLGPWAEVIYPADAADADATKNKLYSGIAGSVIRELLSIQKWNKEKSGLQKLMKPTLLIIQRWWSEYLVGNISEDTNNRFHVLMDSMVGKRSYYRWAKIGQYEPDVMEDYWVANVDSGKVMKAFYSHDGKFKHGDDHDIVPFEVTHFKQYYTPNPPMKK